MSHLSRWLSARPEEKGKCKVIENRDSCRRDVTEHKGLISNDEAQVLFKSKLPGAGSAEYVWTCFRAQQAAVAQEVERVAH